MDIHYSMHHHTYVVTQFSYKLIYMYTLCEILCNFQNSRLLFFFWMVILYINYVHRGEKVLFWYTFELATYIFNSDNIHLYRLIFLFLLLFLSFCLSLYLFLAIYKTTCSCRVKKKLLCCVNQVTDNITLFLGFRKP